MDGKVTSQDSLGKAVPYFEKQIAAIETYKAQCGGGLKPNIFVGASIKPNEQLDRAINLIQSKEDEHALSAIEAKNEGREMR